MRYARLFVALLAACVFIVPAFSMPDNGIASKECEKQMDSLCQQPQASEKAPDLLQEDLPGDMTDDKKRSSAPRSMMDDSQNPCCQNRHMDRNNDDAPRSMMDGKQPGPFCERTQAGQDDKFNPKNMKDGRDCPCGQCPQNPQDPQMDRDGKTAPKSIMDGKMNPCGQNQRIPEMGPNMDSAGEFPK